MERAASQLSKIALRSVGATGVADVPKMTGMKKQKSMFLELSARRRSWSKSNDKKRSARPTQLARTLRRRCRCRYTHAVCFSYLCSKVRIEVVVVGSEKQCCWRGRELGSGMPTSSQLLLASNT